MRRRRINCIFQKNQWTMRCSVQGESYAPKKKYRNSARSFYWDTVRQFVVGMICFFKMPEVPVRGIAVVHLGKGKGNSCTKTRLWYAKTVGQNLCSQQANRNFMQKEALKMSRNAAKLAVMQSVAMRRDKNEKCLPQFVMRAAERQECHFSPVMVVRSIAVHAMPK